MQVSAPNGEKQDAASRLKEAEIYYSQGLIEEALEAYRAILSSPLRLTDHQKATIKERLRELEGMADQDELGDRNELELAEDVVLTTQEDSSEGNVQAILDGAFALRELGLYEEAVNEYVKLFELDYPAENIVPEICKCLMKGSPPSKVKEDVSRIIDEYAVGDHKRAMCKFRLGLEMEHVNRAQYAMELYQEASVLAPEDKRISERINYLARRHVPKKQNLPKQVPRKLQEPTERRKWERINTRIPEFVFAEFEIIQSDGQAQQFKFKVANYSKYGLGFLVPNEQRQILHMIKPGDKIRDITFYARWAIIKVDALIRHITELDSGPYKGQYVIGVESDEIIESSVGL